MATKKNNLTGAISTGIDKLFSTNDAPLVQEVQEAPQPHRAQDVPQADLARDIRDMQAMLEAAEEHKTQGRKGFKMPRLNISLTPSGMDYVRVMAAISGKSVTRYISDLIDREAANNAAIYEQAKEIIKNAR